MRRHYRTTSLFSGGISVDLFAGGGGASLGTRIATGREVDVAIDHDAVAIAVHRRNHPAAEHYIADVFHVSPRAACRGRRVRHLHASPDCRHFSRAKAGRPVADSVRHLASVVIDWAREVRPDVITLENVVEFATWGPLRPDGRPDVARKGESFRAWCASLEALGYAVEWRALRAHDFGAPTSRRRLFLVARCDGQPIRWPTPTHGPGLKPYHTAAEHLDFARPCPSIFGRKTPLADATLRRVAAGVVRFVLEDASPFVVTLPSKPGRRRRRTVAAFLAKHYGGVVGHRPDRPLGTITAVDHHSLVRVKLAQPKHVGAHARLVAPFLVTYYGSAANVGQRADRPLRTITTVDRFALVQLEVNGTTWAVDDIGLRMLAPDELLGCQFGEYAEGYDLSPARTKRDKTRLIGNSVVPHMQAAVVTANLGRTP